MKFIARVGEKPDAFRITGPRIKHGKTHHFSDVSSIHRPRNVFRIREKSIRLFTRLTARCSCNRTLLHEGKSEGQVGRERILEHARRTVLHPAHHSAEEGLAGKDRACFDTRTRPHSTLGHAALHAQKFLLGAL